MSQRRLLEVLGVFARLGVTSFGGPIAHLAHFRRELVERRRWLGDEAYAHLVAYCQFIPGPSSSQVGFLIGWQRAGVPGAIAAFLAFTAPSAALLATAAIACASIGHAGAWIAGMKAAVLGIVAQAVLSMARSLCPDAPRASIAAAVAILCMSSPAPWMQVAALVPAALAGAAFLRLDARQDDPGIASPSIALTVVCCGLLAALLIAVVVLAAWPGGPVGLLASTCLQAGGLVFGGGHVVLPLLRDPLVHAGLMTDDQFLAGYGAAQAVPGPLFTVSAWIGAVIAGWSGAVLAVLAIFAPGLLLALGGLRMFNRLGGLPGARRLVAGLNAGVVGLLGAALWSPIGSEAAHHPLGIPLALAAFIALEAWRLPAWSVVIACAGIAMLSAGMGPDPVG